MGTNPTDSPECVKMLLDAGADPNALDDKGKTPLHVAAQTGGKRSITILLDYGTDVNATTVYGVTALHTSFYFGTVGTATALLYHDYSQSKKPAQRIDTAATFKSVNPDDNRFEYKPIDSPCKRDCHKIWQFLIRDEEKLR